MTILETLKVGAIIWVEFIVLSLILLSIIDWLDKRR